MRQQLQAAIKAVEAALGTGAVAWFTLKAAAENPSASNAPIILGVGLLGGLSYLMFLALLAAARHWGRVRFLALPAVLSLGLLAVLLATAGNAAAAAPPAAAVPPYQEITPTVPITPTFYTEQIVLPSGQTAAVEYRITFGEAIVAGGLVLLIALNLHSAIVQATKDSTT